MPRPIWKGHISFGLVNIPVTLYSAEQTHELSFKMVDSRNNAGIKYQRINEVTGEEVPWDAIVKGYEYEDGEYVLLGDADFASAKPEATQSVDIEHFVPIEDVPPEFFEKPYFIVPARRSEKPYALLREALKESGCAGIAKVVIRTKQSLAAIMVRGRMLVLELLRFPHELREAPEDKVPSTDLSDLKISEKELELAGQLIESMRSDWKPESYKDDYENALLEWIDKKIQKGETAPVKHVERAEEEEGGEVIDMMALLKKSMARASEKADDGKSSKRKRKESA